MTSARAEFEAIVKSYCSGMEGDGEVTGAIMSAYDVSVRRVVGENDDDRPEITVWQIHSKEATRARNNLRHEQLREAGLEGE